LAVHRQEAHIGVRIGLRVGAVTQEQIQERLRVEMARIEYEQHSNLRALMVRECRRNLRNCPRPQVVTS
jgi:hypothetical protein